MALKTRLLTECSHLCRNLLLLRQELERLETPASGDDLELAARYYRAYLELMQHWDEAMPGRIHRVVYEDLVEDAETTVRALLDFCGLRFEQSCLEFHKTERSIATPSSEQVRQPLNRKSLDRWTHYRPWLAALENSLGDARLLYNAPR